MTDIARIDPGPRLSEASVCGDRIYCSGMIPEDTSQDITGQAPARATVQARLNDPKMKVEIMVVAAR